MMTVNVLRLMAVGGLTVAVALSCDAGPRGVSGTKGSRAGDSAIATASAAAAAATAISLGDSMSTGADTSVAPLGFIKLYSELGAGVRTTAELMSGDWMGLGAAVISPPTPSGYDYLPTGQTYVLVRNNGGTLQAGLLSGTTFRTTTMFVSTSPTRSALTTDARLWNISGTVRIYVCYTCDKKACCPVNNTVSSVQGAADAEAIAAAW